MAVMLGAGSLAGAIGMREAIDLLEAMARREAAGQTLISPRQTTRFETGWMRQMFAADYAGGYAVTKAFHLVRGSGVRYLVSLYRLSDGELLALLDGRGITDLRTGAASGVAARHLELSGTLSCGIVGSGHQARMQLESLAAELRIGRATVFSPTRGHRERFAAESGARLGIPVTPADSPERAVRGHELVIVATSATGPDAIVRGAWLDRCRLLCAVGSTRPESVEVDVETFTRAGLVIVDSALAAEEAGDLQRAVQAGLAPGRQLALSQLVAGGKRALPGGYAVFKSVGSGLQDLALAARYYELLGGRPGLPSVEDLASLKVPISAGI